MDQAIQTWNNALKGLDQLNIAPCHVYEQVSPTYLAQLSAYYYGWSLAYSQELAHKQMEIFSQKTSNYSILDISGKSSPEVSVTPEHQPQPDSTFDIHEVAACLADIPVDLRVAHNKRAATNPTERKTKRFLRNLGLNRVKTLDEEFQDTKDFIGSPFIPSATAQSSLAPLEPNVTGSSSKSEMLSSPISGAKTPDSSSELHASTKPSSQQLASELTYNRPLSRHRNKLYSCYMCEKTYRQARDYRAHIAAHKDSSTYKCDICSHALSTSSDYLQHLQEHKQKDLHCCTHCGKYFRDGCTLTTHVRTHTGEKPYKCEICNKQFRQSGTYRRHKKTCHPSSNAKPFNLDEPGMSQ